MAKSLLLLAVAIAVISICSGMKWRDCGSSKAKVTDVRVSDCDKSPICDLKKGTNVTFEVDFAPNEMVEKATSVVHGLIHKIPLPFPVDNPNACVSSNLKCPLKAKAAVAFKSDIYIKNMYPKVRLVVKWELKDQNGNDIFCVMLPAQIVD